MGCQTSLAFRFFSDIAASLLDSVQVIFLPVPPFFTCKIEEIILSSFVGHFEI